MLDPRFPHARKAALRGREARVLALAAALASACAKAPGDARYAPIARLLDGVDGVAADLQTGEQAELLNERRPVHSLARALAAEVVCGGEPWKNESEPDAPCEARIATHGADAPWAIFQTSQLEDLREQAGLPAEASTPPAPERSAIALPTAADRSWGLPHWQARWLSYVLVPPLEARDFETRRVALPPDARLRFAIAAEERTWQIDAAPVDFAVHAELGGATAEIYRRRLDPSRRPEDRGWQEADISLADLAGKSVRFRFSVRASAPGDDRPQLPLWADPRVIAPAASEPRRPFVVLVSLDTLRARSMSAYGYGLGTTPEFQRIAAQGALFENAFTTFSNTLAAHMSMLTGLYPAAHGVYTSARLSAAIPTLAEKLRGAGYQTAAITEDGLITAGAGFARGFAHYVEDKTTAWHEVGARRTFERALAWANAHADEPFFLFVHTYAVHAPYAPGPAYRDLVTAPPTPSADRLSYEQEVREVDDDLARLVGGLDGLLGRDRYLLVVTADHGEEFREHGLVFHVQLYDEVMHVPLLFRWPGRIPAGRVIEQTVSLVDVAPTILGMAGVGERSGWRDGWDLAPLIEGATLAPEPWREVVFAESPQLGRGRGPHTYVGRSGRAKCMLEGGSGAVRCFDLTTDPDERNPLSPNSSAALTALASEVSAYRDRAKRVAPAFAAKPLPDQADA